MDHKSVKRPDGFLVWLRGIFDGILGHAKGFLIIVGLVFGVALAGALYMNHRDSEAKLARNAFYQAQKQLETELKALVPPSAPKEAAKTGEKAAPSVTPGVESLTYQKMDVDSKLPETVKKLQAVAQKYGSTRSGFDAAMALADLYFNHGEFAKAETGYNRALSLAPNSFEKAITLSALGYVQENLAKPEAALQFFQKAIQMGESGLKGDLLLAIARCYEATQNTAKARETYEQVLNEFPNTEFSKTAEIYKAQNK